MTRMLCFIEETQFKPILVACVVELGALNYTLCILSLQIYFYF